MLVGSWDGYPLRLIGAASRRTLLRPCRVIVQGFGEVVSESRFSSQHRLFQEAFKLWNISRGYRLSRHVSRRKVWFKGGNVGFETTYWSSAMSSRVRVSNNEWISALERTVSGILAIWSE